MTRRFVMMYSSLRQVRYTIAIHTMPTMSRMALNPASSCQAMPSALTTVAKKKMTNPTSTTTIGRKASDTGASQCCLSRYRALSSFAINESA